MDAFFYLVRGNLGSGPYFLTFSFVTATYFVVLYQVFYVLFSVLLVHPCLTHYYVWNVRRIVDTFFL